MRKQTDTLLLAIVVAFGVFFFAGLIVIPIIHEAQAKNAIASERNKGQQGSEQGRGSKSSERWCITIEENIGHAQQTHCLPDGKTCGEYERNISRSKVWHIVEPCHQV